MNFPTSPGVVFDRETGRLYDVDGGQVTLLFPWPEMLAYRRRIAAPDWRACCPDLVVPRPRASGAETATGGGVQAPEPLSAEVVAWRQAVEEYCALIPDDVREVVTRYPRGHWPLLSLIARSGSGATDLAASNPALAFMVASCWEFRDGHGARAMDPAPVLLSYRRQREILGWLDFAPTESMRRTIRKIDPAAVNVETLRRLRERVRVAEVAHRLAHLTRINVAVLRLVAEGTVLQVTPRLLEEIALREEEAGANAEVLADAVRMWRLVRPARRLPVFDRPRQIAEVHDQMTVEVNRIRPRGDTPRTFPAPPFPGTEDIIPITTDEMLFEEGRQQHNCVASYAGKIRRRVTVIYRVIHPQRCTLSLVRRQGRWAIEQLKGPCNHGVSTSTWQAVHRWLEAEEATLRARRTDPALWAGILNAEPQAS